MPKKKANGTADIKQANRIRTARYFWEHGAASRQELASALGFSLPTIFQNVADFLEMGFLCESGAYDSTGGRKARVLSIREGFRCAVGLEVTKEYLRLALVDLCGRILDVKHIRCPYSDAQEYYMALGKAVKSFLRKNRLVGSERDRLLGVGISLPGIIDQRKGLLTRSHTLEVQDIEVQRFAQALRFPTCFENDANNAAFAEVRGNIRNLIYLSLNDTVGSAIFLNGQIYRGDMFKSGEQGHVILHPNGRRCYCGKAGCVDAYCSAKLLSCAPEETLEMFFEALAAREPEHVRRWESYRDDLALVISNIRLQMDCDIILGGYVGGYLDAYLPALAESLKRYNNFDGDISYLSVGHYRRECSAVGAARLMMDRSLEQLLSQGGGE